MARVEITYRLVVGRVEEKASCSAERARPRELGLCVLHVKAAHRPCVLLHAILLSY